MLIRSKPDVNQKMFRRVLNTKLGFIGLFELRMTLRRLHVAHVYECGPAKGGMKSSFDPSIDNKTVSQIMLGEYLGSNDWNHQFSEESVQNEMEAPVRTPNRKGGRIPLVAKIILRPANASQRSSMEIAGRCRDVSEKGIGTIVNEPTIVGDFYWVEIDSDELQFQNGICRCIRCQFLREDAFEVGFEFLTETSPKLKESEEATEELL